MAPSLAWIERFQLSPSGGLSQTVAHEDDLSGIEFRDFVRQGAGAATENRYMNSTFPQSGAGNITTTRGGGNRR